MLFLAAACTVPLGDGDRRVVARELAIGVIVPAFDDVAATAVDLAAAIAQLAATPDPTKLDATQLAWRTARVHWKETDAFRFGPAKDLGLSAAIDQAIDPMKIELEIAGAEPVTDAYVAALGANRKGFHAIEYLIFRGDDDATVLLTLTTDPLAVRRRDLLGAYARELARNASALRAAWADGYAASIADPGSDNADYATIKASIDALANESVFQTEVVVDERIGKPMGTASGGTPRPELEESAPSDHSLADMAATLRGIRNVYHGTRDGTPGKGIGTLVAAQSPLVDRDVRAAFDAALIAVAAIPVPYRSALVDQRLEVAAAHAAVKELKRILATEVIGSLGATLKFNANDGD